MDAVSMSWQSAAYIAPLVGAAVISLALASMSWRQRWTPGAISLGIQCLAVVVWSLGYAFELSSPTFEQALSWGKFQYFGITIAPIFWLIFAFQYTSSDSWLTPRMQAALLIIPAIVVILVWTNEQHHLIWASVTRDPGAQPSALDVTHGPAFWIHAIYSYLALLAGTVQLWRTLWNSPRVYQDQVSSLLLGAGAPWLANILYLLEVGPFAHFDPTPFAFAITSATYAGALFRYSLLDIVPVARDTVIENLDEGVLVLDDQNRIVDANPVAQRVIGQPAGAIVGQPVAQILTGWPEVIQRYRTTLSAEEDLTITLLDKPHVLALRIAPLYDRRGARRGRLIVWRDVTEQRRIAGELERQLRETLLLNRAIAATTSALDPQVVLQTICEELCNALGVPQASVTLLSEDRAALEVIAESTPDQSRSAIGSRVPLHESPDTHAVLRTRHATQTDPGAGGDPPIATQLNVPLVIRGEAIGTIQIDSFERRVFTRDEIALAERVAATASQALEHAWLYTAVQHELIERRRAEVELAKAKEAAESANRAKSVFLAHMSHELRTPLTAMLGYSDLLQIEARTHGYESIVADISTIQSAGRQLLDMINNVLDLSKIEAGRIEIFPETVAVENLISDVIATVHPLVRRQNNALVVEIPPGIGTMQTDVTMVRQILVNLASNAAKFTKEGRVTLRCARIAASNEADEVIQFQVQDTGIGIEPGQLAHIFEPFVQADHSITTHYGGTGLGLAICQRYCQMLGGNIQVASELGGGSIFTIHLPAFFALDSLSDDFA
jgi:PAS domain S-box-containing protein